MKALCSTAVGGPETLQLLELPDPVAAPGQLLIEVAGCGINFPDVLIIEDKYQFKGERPFAPGCEVSGIVLEVGPGVPGWRPGDRVIATLTSGGLAERVVVDAEQAFRLPAGLDLLQGAGLLLTYGTVAHALIDRAQLAPTDSVLVLGAAGGVGLAAVEVAKALGARVAGAASTAQKAEAARLAGADATLAYGSAERDAAAWRALAADFKALSDGRGFDVILDPVGGPFAEAALRAIAWEGRYLVVGFPAGVPRVPLNLPLLKGCDIRGVFYGAFAARDPQANRSNVQQLLSWWLEGKIAPKITETFPLERGAEALQRLATRQAVGKVVVAVTTPLA